MWDVCIAVLVVCAAVFALSETLADPDLWGHTLFGLDMLRDGGLPFTDPYSYLTFGHRWINHEVLSELSMGVMFRAFGTVGLTTMKLLVVAAIFSLGLWHMLRRGLEPIRAGIVMMLALLGMLPGMLTVRPQIFTYLFFLLMMLILEESERRSTRLIWALPLLVALWINFHGGVLAGVVVICAWSGVKVAEALIRWREQRSADERARALRWIAVGGLSAAALLLNPYGWRLPAFLIAEGTVARPDITEWRALSVTSPHGIIYLILVLLGLATLYRTRRQRGAAPLFVLAALTLGPLTAFRHLQLFALGFVVLMADHLASAWTRPAEDVEREGHRTARFRPALTAALLLLSLTLLGGAIPRLGCIRIEPTRAMAEPARAVALLEASGVRGNLAVFFDWGEYAIWHLQPGIKVGMDGRRETVYPDSTYEYDLMFRVGKGEWSQVLDKRPTDMALVPANEPTFNLMSLRPDWELVYSDSIAGLFARRGSDIARSIRATAVPELPVDGAGLCFP